MRCNHVTAMLHPYTHYTGIVFKTLNKNSVKCHRTRIINALIKEPSSHDVNATTEKSH